jgi:alkylhydroperoxidase family enzyme
MSVRLALRLPKHNHVRMTTRLAPLTPPYDPEIDETLQRLMGPGLDVEPLALFRTIAHHPALLERFRQTGSTLLSFGRLPAADRETVIHRTTARCGADYEWGVHAVHFAGALDLDEAWLRATWHGAPADFADPGQALLVRFADELHDAATVSDETWAALRARYDDAELVELVCLAGFYHLISYVCRAFCVEREAWAAPAPAA